MISTQSFYSSLRKRGVELFAGVPDSLLKHLCAFLDSSCSAGEHIITANEGNAIALAAGYHLATGKIGAVYMQNSGLGNCVNPLASLTDPEVYCIPVLLIIGWRGEPGVKDEPQHVKQGRITPGQLDLLQIPWQILDADSDQDEVLERIFAELREKQAPAALLVRKGTFSEFKADNKKQQEAQLSREQALELILDLASPQDLFISTTGKTSRELFELRAKRGEQQQDFLTVGCMGHTSSIALGAALGRPERRVVCLDGDGSLIMHLGSMPVAGNLGADNLVHVLLNNQAHESVGGQPTVAGEMDFAAIGRACGYKAHHLARGLESLEQAWKAVDRTQGPQLLEIRLRPGARQDLGRPSSSPQENKKAFALKARSEITKLKA